MDNTSSPTIFVTIPAYRDSESRWTVWDLYSKAAHPDSISVGLCWQHHPTEDAHMLPYQLPPHLHHLAQSNVRVVEVLWTDATGPCYARHLAQGLYRGERYWLSIDSHMRFVKNWDTLLIGMLESCRGVHSKPIITGYPAGYELIQPSDEEGLPTTDNTTAPPFKICKDTFPPFLCVDKFNPSDGMLRLTGKAVSKPFHRPTPSLFWVSGASFADASALLEVPYDPYLPSLFFGEEALMSMRLYTHGYGFFAPQRHIVYHLWQRTHRPTFRQLPPQPRTHAISLNRVRHLLGMSLIEVPPKGERETKLEYDEAYPESLWLHEIDKYGLGSEKTREDFYKFTGVDFAQGTIEQRSIWGGVGQACFVEGLLQLAMSFGVSS